MTNLIGDFTPSYQEMFIHDTFMKEIRKALLAAVVNSTKDKEVTQVTEHNLQDVLNELRARGGEQLVEMLTALELPEDGGVQRHAGHYIALPQGMSLERAVQDMQRLQQDLETGTESTHTFKYAYEDVGVALDKAIKQLFGFGVQKPTFSMFGMRRPQTVSVTVGLNERGDEIKVRVPSGKIGLPGLYDVGDDIGWIEFDYYMGRPYIKAAVRKKHQPIIDQLITLVKRYLREESIYRGQIVTSGLQFVDTRGYDPDALVLTENNRHFVESYLMYPIINPDGADELNLERNRAYVLTGTYGTGKSMFLRELAMRGKQAGWTVFINSDDDELENMLKLAKHYQPAIIQIEDIDLRTDQTRTRSMNGVLNALDGAFNKQDRIVTVMTTNHSDRIHASLLRPGRVSAILEFGALDGPGFKRLMGQCGLDMNADIPWNEMAETYRMLMPCYVKEAANRLGIEWATNGRGEITTEQVRYALESMKQHYDVQQAATDTHAVPTLDSVMTEVLADSLKKVATVRQG